MISVTCPRCKLAYSFDPAVTVKEYPTAHDRGPDGRPVVYFPCCPGRRCRAVTFVHAVERAAPPA